MASFFEKLKLVPHLLSASINYFYVLSADNLDANGFDPD